MGALVAEWATGSGDPDAAIQSYEQIIETSPNDVGALNNLAFLYYQRGDQRGLELARRAYELAPSHPVVMDTYGWLLVEAGEVERGLPILRESVQVLAREHRAPAASWRRAFQDWQQHRGAKDIAGAEYGRRRFP